MSAPLRLLLVEDSENDALLIERALRRDDLAAVCTRIDSLAGLQAALAAGPWDGLLTDFQLPGFSGLDVIGLAQAQGLAGPVIVVSGTIGEESAVAALKTGAHEYVMKDDMARLGPALRRELRAAAVRREQQAAAEALRASEMRLRLITNSMLDLVSEVDLEGRLRYVSPSHRGTLGYDPAALVGQSLLTLVHPDDQAEALAIFQAAAARARPASAVCRARHAAGHYVWIESSGSPLFDEAGRLVGAVVSSRDITARRQAEQAEREQRTLAEALSNTAAALSSSLDLPVVLERVLDNVGQVVRHEAALILLADGTEAWVAAERGFDRRGAPLRLNGLRLALAEVPDLEALIRQDQAVIYAGPPLRQPPALAAALAWAQAFAGAPLRHRGQTLGMLCLQGTASGAFAAAQVDRLQAFADQAAAAIANARLFDSERRRVAELKRSNALTMALAQVAARLPATRDVAQVLQTLGTELRALRLSCFVALRESDSSALTIRYTSLPSRRLKALERLTGLTMAGLRLTPENFIGLERYATRNQPEYFRSLPDRVSATLRLGLPQSVVRQALTLAGIGPADNVAVLPLAMGETWAGLLNIWGPDLQATDLTALTVFAHQVTAALQTAELVASLDQARRVAEAANELKSQFLANISHELRTPLTGILGSLDLVIDNVCETPAEERRFLGLAREAGQQLLKLINDLLDLARIEAGQMAVRLQVFDLVPVITEACTLCRPVAEAKRLPVRMDLPPTLMVWADPDRLTQIMLNLVGNAIKFTENGEVRITAARDEPAGWATISVQDTGIGIPPSLQAQLFRPFVQADASSTRRYGGTGLGLAISRSLTELMQGELSLCSAGAGAGSTFRLSLRLGEPAELVGPPVWPGDARPAEEANA